jgi:ABC-type oligopeptide transport system substrate-binding subunit
VIPVERRNEYMEALEAASVDGDIEPCAKFFGGLVKDNLEGKPDADARFGAPYPEIVDAIAAARLGSFDARYLANEDVAQAIIDAAPMVPLAHVGGATAYRTDVIDTDAVQFGLDEFQPAASPVGAEYFDSMRPGDRDTFTWLQTTEPATAFCANETDVDTLRACAQVNQPLVEFEVGSGEVAFGSGLTEFFQADEDATVWTFRLADGVKVHDGSDLDAADVVRSLAMHWDASDPLHDGDFPMFQRYFGAFLEP